MRVKVHSWLLSAGGNAKKRERENSKSKTVEKVRNKTKRKKERGKEINQQNTQLQQ